MLSNIPVYNTFWVTLPSLWVFIRQDETTDTFKYVFNREKKENQNGFIISLWKKLCDQPQVFNGGPFNQLVGREP